MLLRQLLILSSLLLLSSVQPCAAAADSLVAQGERIYHTGMRLDGSAVQASVQTDVALPPQAAACVNCHRRSGYGISEGGSRSLTLTAPALFSASEKPPLRPAYNDATLIRAIAGGIAADGRQLHATMPRFVLNAQDAKALTAYLRTLGAEAPEGLTDSHITFATIIAERAPEQEKQAVERVMQRYVELKNAESRRETERSHASQRHYYGRTRQRAHRTWQLQIWTLKGKPSRWPAQLQTLYEKSPPFAIVSGSAGDDWQAVHEFCELKAVPCLLPLSASPFAEPDDFYSLYFSTGPRLEASVIASHISSRVTSDRPSVLVIHTGDSAAAAGLDAMHSALHRKTTATIRDLKLSNAGARSKRRLRRELTEYPADVLVLWQEAETVAGLIREIDSALLPRTVYTANTWTDWLQQPSLGATIQRDLLHIYPYSLPQQTRTQFPRESLWLKQRGLSDLDPVHAAKVLYACRITGMGLADIQNNFSQEYLLEALEHALDGTQLTSLYPRTSLGPNQRLLSRGAYVVDLSLIENGLFANPAWVQP